MATALAAIWWAGEHGRAGLLQLVARVRTFGLWAPVAFIAVYALAVLAFIPGSLLTVLGGALFGFWPGVGCALVGASLGSTAAFVVGRYLARGLVEHRLADMPRFLAIDRAVRADGRRIVMLLRLSPVVPFNVLNYALGLTTIRLRDFVAGGVGMLPGTLVYTYAGKVAGEALAIAGGVHPARDRWYYLVLILGLIATAVATVVVGRTARRALAEATE